MKLSHAQIQALERSVGVPENKIVLMSAISYAESSGRTDAVNNGSATNSVEYSVGLWQINHNAHKEYSIEQLKDPNINAQMMIKILNSEGLRAWGVYTNGSYKNHLADAQAAYNAGSGSTKIVISNPDNSAASGGVGAALFFGLVLYAILD